jgi:hypothetical protein
MLYHLPSHSKGPGKIIKGIRQCVAQETEQAKASDATLEGHATGMIICMVQKSQGNGLVMLLD